MNRARRRFDPPSGLTGSSQQQTPTAKPNRLSRRYRQTQQTQADVSSPSGQQTDFKTPTRVPRAKAGGGSFSEESPHNDSDFQQDIIWDATSPSPNRHGKRGKKQRAGIVDISEIVNRIAPKHGRPEVSEPTLQQWIGDSATIPCTPDVQAPKPKKKSPRPNGVDDLLKLAKQFDFNMFHQDDDDEEEEKAEEVLHQQSQELLSEDILDLEHGDFLPSVPGSCQPAVKAAVRTDVQIQQDQHMEDDFDFLFDGPTQRVSGDFSQVSSARPTQVKPASGVSSKEASGKPPSSSHGPTSGVSTTNTKVTVANAEFDDDWENDDLLNDSLVLEMTQNPQNFGTPKHSSTQKLPGEIKYQSPVNVPVSGSVGLSAASKVEKDNVRQRTTFKLEPNPNFSFKSIQTDTRTNSKMDFSSDTAHKDTQQSRFSSGIGVLAKGGCQRTWQTSNSVKSDPQKPPFHQSTSVASSGAKYNTAASAPSNTSATKTAQSFSAHREAPAGSDLLDEDLDSFFSSDLVWDDPADDDLLCELCEDVENQMQSSENVSTQLPVGPTSNQRAALPPATRSWDNRTQPANQQPFPPKLTPAAVPCASGRPAVGSLAGGFGGRMNAVTDSFRLTQPKNISGSTNSSGTCAQVSSRLQAPPQGNTRKDQFTFKKPNTPVSMVTNTAVAKCSAAEIELKKQQAMERRRQRLQAAQNPRAPT